MADITLDGIAHAYTPGGPYALRRLNHVWQRGRAYALLGPSGCGKTTLLNIISGLVIPSEGRVLFDGRDVTMLPTEARNIAQVFQFPVVYDTMTVAQNLAYPLKNRRMKRPAIAERVGEIADLLGLAADLGRRARGLSADTKQKVSLGRGLVRADVNAVLFDEPLTVIDPALKWELRSKLKMIHQALDLLMIYVTHDQVEALTFADEVVVMNDGQVLQVGTPAALFEQPEHTFVGYFIGSPGMNLLPAQVVGNHARIDGQVVTLPATYPSLPAHGTVRLGVRPEHAFLARERGLSVHISRIEDLGRRRLARITLGRYPLVATVPPEFSPRGDEAALRLEPEHLHVYVDERRIEGQHVEGRAA